MRIPVWLTLGLAALVAIFGVYRIRLAFRSEPAVPEAPPRKGLYAMGRRSHVLIGVVYLLLSTAMVATTFGWNPFGDLFGPKRQTPSKDTARTRTQVPIDQLPNNK